MRKLPMLTVPLKETTPVDWTSSLRQYLISHYGSWEEFSSAIDEFNNLRNETIDCNHDTVGLCFYRRYYCELDQLDQRIVSKELNLNMVFTWKDAFERASSTAQHSFAFEKAAVLFNFAALFSIVASNQFNNHDTALDLSEDVEYEKQNLKNSIKNFQNSAGVYQYVSENFLHTPSNDLNQTCIKFLGKLMLAQAQEVFTYNVIFSSNNAKSSLLAKLFQSSANFYKSCHDLITSLVKDDIWCSVFSNWTNIVNVKHHFFESLANYHQSLAYSGSSNYGQAIGYMKNALEILKTAKAATLANHSSSLDTTLNFNEIIKSVAVKELTEKMAQELKLLEKDNDYIYHESVPQKYDLTAIKAMDAVSATKFESILTNPALKMKNSRPLFQKIVPLKVHEWNSVYSEEKAKKLRSFNEKIDVSIETIRSFLEYTSLPQSLNSLKAILKGENGAVEFDSEFKDLYKQTLSPLSKSILKDEKIDFAVLKSKKAAVVATLINCENLLKSDEQRYNQNKANFGPNWSQEEPSIASMDIRNDLIKIKKSLIDTEHADKEMTESYKSIEYLYQLLRLGSSGKNEIKNYISNNVNSQNEASLIDDSLLDFDEKPYNEAKKLISSIESNLSAINHLSSEAQTLFTQYKNDVHNDDISDILVVTNDLPEDQMKLLFAKQMEKFEPVESRIMKIIQKQSSLMNVIDSDLASLNSNSAIAEKKQKFNKKQEKKFKMYQIVKEFEDSYSNVKLGFDNAKSFYDQLESFLSNLETRTRNFFEIRGQEASRIANPTLAGVNPTLTGGSGHKLTSDDINERLTRLNLSTSSTSIPTTTTTNSNIYSSDFNNQNKYTSISATPWSQAPLIPKKSPPTSSPVSYHQQQAFPVAPQPPSGNSLSNLYGYSQAPPSLPSKEPNKSAQLEQQQTGIAFYNNPANFNNNMYTMFNDHK